MNVLIIEDEKLAQEYLLGLLEDTGYDLQVAGTCNSVKNAIKWFINNPEPDLVFMDIDLGDGLCFEIFDVVTINCPIIFTTAYDEYAIQAFKVNSIDYLLKPVDQKGLLRAINKFSRLSSNDINISGISSVAKQLSEQYKSRFIIKIGNRLKSLPSEDILFFESKDKVSYVITKEKRSFLIDYSLDKLESIMNPSMYFRVNRNFIISFNSIIDIVSFSSSRLKITVLGSDNDKIIVSRERVSTFKEWLDR